MEDYQIISPLNYTLGPLITSNKVREILSNDKIYNLHCLDVANLEINGITKERDLLLKIKERTQSAHPNLIKFINFFVEESMKQIYILTEHCSKGNLQEFIENCHKKNKHLREELVLRVVYQILCALKTVEEFSGKLCVDEIFLDDDFNVKLFNFNVKSSTKLKSLKVSQVGSILYTLCTLKPFVEKSENYLQHVKIYYSASLVTLLEIMLRDHSNLYKNIDKILCNRTILLKSSQWNNKDKPFFIVTNPEEFYNKKSNPLKTDSSEVSETYLQKLQYLRNKEISLQSKEDKLKERDHALNKREKKINLMEKLVKEKLTRAEVYLKRNRDNKSSSNLKLCTKKELDTSFSADCGDTAIVTSKKFDAQIVSKPAAFTRSRSERRVKFKGHSPLREINFNRRRSFVNKRLNEVIVEEVDEGKKENLQVDKVSGAGSSLSGGSKNSRMSKKLFADGGCPVGGAALKGDCRPISWTEDSKKYAFDLLRIMNGAIERDELTNNNEIKHTYL